MSGGRIPRAFIDELLVRVDIVDLIDSYVPLKKTGGNYVARCPFHTEKTPSFSVNRKKQFFHCFGCGASGNAIGFLMDFNHLNFVEAVEDLAAFAGLEVPRESPAYQPEHNKADLSGLYLVMEQVAAFYVAQLRGTEQGKKAVAYLKKRGIGGGVANEFMLGYAPDEWQGLVSRFKQELLIDTGMAISKEDGRAYDRFRGRIMFPIRDKRGRIIGFGGRVLDNSLPKYLNSPETSLFHKGQEVYGLYELLKRSSKPQRILMVEGYMDVIALAQSGIDYAVAVLGTAVSQAHINLLFRFSSELVFCFDGDNAGKEAAWKAMESAFACLKDGRSCRILLLPQGQDPDSLVREEGVDKFVKRIESAQVLSDYFFGHLSEKLNLSEMEGRAQFISSAKPYLEKLPEGVFKEMMTARMRELSGTVTLDVLAEAATLHPKPSKMPRQKNGRPPLVRQTLALLIQNPTLVELLEEKNIDWDSLDFKGADKFKEVVQVISDEKPANTGVLLELYRDKTDESIIRQLASLPLEVPQTGVDAEFNDALDRLIDDAMRLKLDRLQAKLESKEGLKQHELEEFQRLSKARFRKNSANL